MSIGGIKGPSETTGLLKIDSTKQTPVKPCEKPKQTVGISQKSTLEIHETAQTVKENGFSELTDVVTEERMQQTQDRIEKKITVLDGETLRQIVNTKDSSELDKTTYMMLDIENLEGSEVEKKNSLADNIYQKHQGKLEAAGITATDLKDFFAKVSLDVLINAEKQGLGGKEGLSGVVTGTGTGGHYVNSIITSLTTMIDQERLTPGLLAKFGGIADATTISSGLEEGKEGLLKAVMQDIAFPDKIAQHSRGTCAATTAQIFLVNTAPEKYADIIKSLATGDGAVATGLINGGMNRLDRTLIDDASGRSVTGRLIQPALMEYAKTTHTYDNLFDAHVSKTDPKVYKTREALAENLRLYLGATMNNDKINIIIKALKDGPEALDPTNVMGRGFSTAKDLKDRVLEVIDTIRPPLSDTEKTDIQNAVEKMSRNATTGLMQSDTGRILDGLGYSVTIKTPGNWGAKPTSADLFSDLQKHINTDNKGPAPVGLRWGDAAHEVLITKLDGQFAYFENPWGELQKMPIDQFKERLNGISLVDKSYDMAKLPGKASTPSNYTEIDRSNYMKQDELIKSANINEELRSAFTSSLTSISLNLSALDNFLKVMEKSGVELQTAVKNKFLGVNTTDTKAKINALMSIVTKSDGKVEETDLKDLVNTLDINKLDELNAHSTAVFYAGVLNKSGYLDESSLKSVIKSPGSEIALKATGAVHLLLANGDLLHNEGIINLRSDIAKALKDVPEVDVSVLRPLYNETGNALKEAQKMLETGKGVKGEVIDRLKDAIASGSVQKATDLKNIYSAVSKDLISWEAAKGLIDHYDSFDSDKRGVIENALKAIELGQKLQQAGYFDDGSFKNQIDGVLGMGKSDGGKKDDLAIIISNFQGKLNKWNEIKPFIDSNIVSKETAKTITDTPGGLEAQTFNAFKDAFSAGDKALLAGLITKDDFNTEIIELYKSSDSDKINKLNAAKAKFDAKNTLFEGLKTNIKEVWTQAEGVITEKLLTHEEVFAKVKGIFDGEGSLVEKQGKLDTLKEVLKTANNTFTTIDDDISDLDGHKTTDDLKNEIRAVLTGSDTSTMKASVERIHDIYTKLGIQYKDMLNKIDEFTKSLDDFIVNLDNFMDTKNLDNEFGKLNLISEEDIKKVVIEKLETEIRAGHDSPAEHIKPVLTELTGIYKKMTNSLKVYDNPVLYKDSTLKTKVLDSIRGTSLDVMKDSIPAYRTDPNRKGSVYLMTRALGDINVFKARIS